MASQQVICASNVYELKKQTIGKDKWVESWLSLDNEGILTWRKDRESSVLGKADLKLCYKDIKFEPSAPAEPPHSPITAENPNQKLYPVGIVIVIPMQTFSQSKNVEKKEETKKFSVKSDAQLQGWLDSFAKSLSKFDQMKSIQEKLFNANQQHAIDNSNKKEGRFVMYTSDWMPIFWKEFLKVANN